MGIFRNEPVQIHIMGFCNRGESISIRYGIFLNGFPALCRFRQYRVHILNLIRRNGYRNNLDFLLKGYAFRLRPIFNILGFEPIQEFIRFFFVLYCSDPYVVCINSRSIALDFCFPSDHVLGIRRQVNPFRGHQLFLKCNLLIQGNIHVILPLCLFDLLSKSGLHRTRIGYINQLRPIHGYLIGWYQAGESLPVIRTHGCPVRLQNPGCQENHQRQQNGQLMLINPKELIVCHAGNPVFHPGQTFFRFGKKRIHCRCSFPTEYILH